MSVPAALTAIVILLGVIALVVVGVLVLAAVVMFRILKLERQVRRELGWVGERVRATVEEVGRTARNVTSTVNSLGSGARYAGLAAEAAGALLAWRKSTRDRPAKKRRFTKARLLGWAVPTGMVAFQLWRQRRHPSGPPGAKRG